MGPRRRWKTSPGPPPPALSRTFGVVALLRATVSIGPASASIDFRRPALKDASFICASVIPSGAGEASAADLAPFASSALRRAMAASTSCMKLLKAYSSWPLPPFKCLFMSPREFLRNNRLHDVAMGGVVAVVVLHAGNLITVIRADLVIVKKGHCFAHQRVAVPAVRQLVRADDVGLNEDLIRILLSADIGLAGRIHVEDGCRVDEDVGAGGHCPVRTGPGGCRMHHRRHLVGIAQ